MSEQEYFAAFYDPDEVRLFLEVQIMRQGAADAVLAGHYGHASALTQAAILIEREYNEWARPAENLGHDLGTQSGMVE